MEGAELVVRGVYSKNVCIVHVPAWYRFKSIGMLPPRLLKRDAPSKKEAPTWLCESFGGSTRTNAISAVKADVGQAICSMDTDVKGVGFKERRDGGGKS